MKFLHHIFFSIVPASITTLATVFPSSSSCMAQKHFRIEVDKFEKYVICKKCGSLYRYKECIETSVGSRQTPKVCNHIEYPNHPFQSQRVPCGQNLLTEIVLKSGRKFSPIVDRLSQILTVNDNIEKCELWRMRKVPDGLLCDIYDGTMWKSFLSYKGRPFLAKAHYIGLMLNCDWFQHTSKKFGIGVLYLTILNLPQSIPSRPENLIVAGIIPGPKEPSQHEMNSYLRPHVKKLNMLQTDGFEIKKVITISEVLLCY